jgi:hypothetical protein
MEIAVIACMVIVAMVAGYLAAVLQQANGRIADVVTQLDSIQISMQGVTQLLAENNRLLHDVPAPPAPSLPDGFYMPQEQTEGSPMASMRRVDSQYQVPLPGRK